MKVRLKCWIIKKVVDIEHRLNNFLAKIFIVTGDTGKQG